MSPSTASEAGATVATDGGPEAGPPLPATTSVSAEGSSPRRTPAYLLLLPGAVLLGVIFFYPVLGLIKTSFTEPTLGFENYTKLFSSPAATQALIRTLIAAIIISACCLIVAFPYAYMMTVVRPGVRTLMLVLISIPFWTSLIARTFAWLVLEQRGGLIERAAAGLGIDGFRLIGTTAGVVLAMVQILLVYMVFPLYSAMNSINRRLMDAAHVCGAGRVRAFFRIYVPLALPGINAGVSLVFLLTLGFYVTPALLGSSHDAMIGQIIGVQVEELLDFPTASAYSVILLVVMVFMLGVLLRGIRLTNGGGSIRSTTGSAEPPGKTAL